MKHSAHTHRSESILGWPLWRRGLLLAALAALLLAASVATPPAPAAAQDDDVLVSNVAYRVDTSTPAGRQNQAVTSLQASAITTGGNPAGYELTSVTLALAALRAGETPVPDIGIWSDSDGDPGEELFSLDNPPDFAGAISTTPARYAFTAPAGTVLEPSTTYWVVVDSSIPVSVYVATIPQKTTTSDPGWSLCDCTQRTSIQGGVLGSWREISNLGSFSMSWHGHPVTPTPPPGTLVSNLGQPAATATTDLGEAGTMTIEAAASFETGPHDGDGFGVTSVTLRLAASGNPVLALAIHADASGAPDSESDPVITLDSATLSIPVIRSYTFNAPPSSVLDPDTTYWLVAKVTGGSAVWQKSRTLDEDEGSSPGWSIANATAWRDVRTTNTWSTDTTSPPKFSVQGYALPPPTKTEAPGEPTTMVSNMTARTGQSRPFGGEFGHNYGVGFRTGTNEAGYVLESVTFRTRRGDPEDLGGTITPIPELTLYEGEDLSDLSSDSGVRVEAGQSETHASFQDHTINMRTHNVHTTLRPNRTYWLVLSTPRNHLAVWLQTTVDQSESDGGQPGWTIEDRGGSFDTRGWTLHDDIPLVSIQAAPLQDLPTTHLTPGYVERPPEDGTVGSPSSGTLDPVLDASTRTRGRLVGAPHHARPQVPRRGHVRFTPGRHGPLGRRRRPGALRGLLHPLALGPHERRRPRLHRVLPLPHVGPLLPPRPSRILRRGHFRRNR